MIKKFLFITLVAALLFVVIFEADFFKPNQEIIYGVTFSQKYSRQLGLNWRDNYSALLDDLKVDHFRLVAYWDLLEPIKDQYDFTDLDWQMDQAKSRHAKVILVIGERLPRWPECHYPAWLKQNEKQAELEELIKLVVKRYRNYNNLIWWQVDNEPFLTMFGECPALTMADYQKRLALVRSLDSRPIMVTDSGELSWWTSTADLADILGSSLYRIVGDKRLGYYRYIFPASFYTFKKFLALNFFGASKVIFSEVQLEPWTITGFLSDLSQAEQEAMFGPKKIRQTLDFAKSTGYDEFYLWGAEWWYWQKLYGNQAIWETVKEFW